jgi:hypothetical protein
MLDLPSVGLLLPELKLPNKIYFIALLIKG